MSFEILQFENQSQKVANYIAAQYKCKPSLTAVQRSCNSLASLGEAQKKGMRAVKVAVQIRGLIMSDTKL